MSSGIAFYSDRHLRVYGHREIRGRVRAGLTPRIDAGTTVVIDHFNWEGTEGWGAHVSRLEVQC